MGYWGYYPADSDEAWELKDRVDDAINHELDRMFSGCLFEEKNVPDFMMKKELKRRNHESLFNMWYRIGVVQLLLQTGVSVDISRVVSCIDYFQCLENDYKTFSKGWRDGIAFERIFKRTKGAFIQLFNDNKNNIKVLAPRGWLKRPWEKSGASWTGCVEAVEKDLQEEEQNGG